MSNAQPAEAPKGCYNCMKRRIICDRTEPECAKCLKKGLTCPGMGIRYRFNDGIAARGKLKGRTYTMDASKLPENGTIVTAFPAKLKWVQQGVAKRSKRTQKEAKNVTKDHPEEDLTAVVDSADIVTQVIEATEDTLPGAVNNRTNQVILSPNLQILDAKTRYLFAHFSNYVSPTMTFIDGVGNGYRHHILPQGVSDPMVQRAVCVASAFHLSVKQPELRLPAEAGRAAIITKMRETATHGHVLNLTTYSTLVLLFVGELITGSDDIVALYRMLLSFVKAHQEASSQKTPLEEFLEEQTKLFAFFTEPAMSETDGMARFIQHPEPDITEVQQASQIISHYYRVSYRQASALYLLRAQSHFLPMDETLAADMTAELYDLLASVDQTIPGAHALVWPYFVAAAESTSLEHRNFFFDRLKYIWETTRYQNVKVALDALGRIWEMRGTPNEVRWTRLIPDIGVPIM